MCGGARLDVTCPDEWYRPTSTLHASDVRRATSELWLGPAPRARPFVFCSFCARAEVPQKLAELLDGEQKIPKHTKYVSNRPDATEWKKLDPLECVQRRDAVTFMNFEERIVRGVNREVLRIKSFKEKR